MNRNRRRNSIELVKLCAQSGATGRQSVDESTRPLCRKNRRKRRSPSAINDACRFAVRAYTPYFWSIVSYLFIFHRTAAPGAINRFSFVAGIEENIYIYVYVYNGIPLDRGTTLYQFSVGWEKSSKSSRKKIFPNFFKFLKISVRVLVGFFINSSLSNALK